MRLKMGHNGGQLDHTFGLANVLNALIGLAKHKEFFGELLRQRW